MAQKLLVVVAVYNFGENLYFASLSEFYKYIAFFLLKAQILVKLKQ